MIHVGIRKQFLWEHLSPHNRCIQFSLELSIIRKRISRKVLFHKCLIHILNFPSVFKFSVIGRIITIVYVMPQFMQQRIVLNELAISNGICMSFFPTSVTSFVHTDD